ncbi:hypothetical protein [Halobaculum sp. MBLA0143]|uniref:hypothetical protein n=1 Tax=Halobaculum sp. MBLA0143 TaxID=3079933 RepID=UPI003525E328
METTPNMDVVIAAYLGFGLFLVQASHTVHAAQTYFQKQVRLLEGVFGWFERTDPRSLDRVWLSWLPTLSSDSPQRRLDEFHGDAQGEARFPWELDPVQQNPDALPGPLAELFALLGLHATNLYYCLAMSVVYGALGYAAVRWFPPLGPVTLSAVVVILSGFTVLHLFSWYAVGSSIVLTLLEGNLLFNVLVLSAINRGTVELGDAVGLLQFGAALVVAPLVFWLQFQRQEGNINYGQFVSFYNVMVPILYAEFFVLVLSLHFK